MKSVLTITSLLLFNWVVAQPFLPMLEEDHQWSVDVYWCPFGGPDPYTVTYQLTIVGEEVVNNITYKVVESSASSNAGCLVREENGIIYKYNPDINDEEIMYDFNLEIGDTFTMLDSPSCTLGDSTPGTSTEVTVINTSEQMIAGAARKVIEFSASAAVQETWIEGIGSVTGFEPYVEILDATCWSTLVCFNDNGEIYFFNNATSCDNTMGIVESVQDYIRLYPVPVTNAASLYIPNSLAIQSVKIIDVFGRTLKEIPALTNPVAIYANDYPTGMYFYQVYSDGKILKTARFIVE